MISQVRQAGLGLSWARQGHSRRRHCSSCGLCILKDVMAKSMWYDCQPWSPVSSSKLILISASVLKQELGSCIGGLNSLQKGTVTSTKDRLCSFASRCSILLHKSPRCRNALLFLCYTFQKVPHCLNVYLLFHDEVRTLKLWSPGWGKQLRLLAKDETYISNRNFYLLPWQ
ncbi:uncharacterized protein LOC120509988 isoform X2 [Passer montanus]|uniref:uncharacterized protein LOC120509988 isoform X2 n=1 Tax=Passer montanus TaxID=9160 RepID=UPI0019618443|nr:uncharacterized protein LOC120509988 isoform X2 [Passer montanus]